MLIEKDACAMVLVDYQTKLMPVIHDADAVLQEARFLAKVASLLEVPVVGTEQYPERLGGNDEELKALCAQTFDKLSFSAARDGRLLQYLKTLTPAVSQVILGGVESHICLLQTALELQDAGLQCFVVPSACGSRKPEDHQLAMQRLQQAGVVLASAESVAFEWLGHSKHPRFKDVQALVKPRA
ncbi:MAG: isochorismatase family protein [Lautropia sp.]|nr:isochorismatase family protein [Lautropia sp.]